MERLKTDKYIFTFALVLLLIICLPIFAFPNKSGEVMDQILSYITNNFGFIYIWTGLAALAFGIWIVCSPYGRIVLGDSKEKPEFRTISWAGMLFCSGIGSSVLYWGIIEWVYYLKAPPLGIEIGSWQAMEWAASYGLFHWGPTGWMMYVLPALPIGYSYYVKKKPILKISESCRKIIGDRVDGNLGRIIDVAFMFGLIGGASTTLGLGIPMVSAGISRVLQVQNTIALKMVVLLLVTAIFATSAYFGLKKGIQLLSNINIFLLLCILLIVLIFGPTIFIIKMGTTSMGILAQNFIRMSTWMDPVLQSGFPESWTIFYWAWWTIYAPFMGLFIARISKGRSIRNIVGGTVLFGSLGCMIIFIIMGNMGLHLQLSGKVDVATLLSLKGASETIVEIITVMPVGNLLLVLFLLTAIFFLATTFDSASYTLAAVTTKKLPSDRDPEKWNRLFWAFALSLLPASLMLAEGSLSNLQTASILAGLPVTVILVVMMISFVQTLRDEQTKDIVDAIEVEENNTTNRVFESRVNTQIEVTKEFY